MWWKTSKANRWAKINKMLEEKLIKSPQDIGTNMSIKIHFYIVIQINFRIIAEMYSFGPPHMAGQKQDDQLEHTLSSYVKIRDVALKTCQSRWMIGRSGERESGISVVAMKSLTSRARRTIPSGYQNNERTLPGTVGQTTVGMMADFSWSIKRE